ncbi:hypothetical protein ACLVWQ_19605 [Streptomyces sp. CWNU-52B]|uniref:hypothetical protein n=1 Tax=unclassified Streptomyces TaxID=2593676 RepID=UPI0039C4215B
MADKHCVSPGGDPWISDRWLDRDAAERLLRGEPLEAVDADIRDRADRLAEALGSLGAQVTHSAPADAELPGEAAALAAFRTAHTGRSAQRIRSGETAGVVPSAGTRPSAAAMAPKDARTSKTSNGPLDAGLVRIGRSATDRRVASLWGRPVRYGLAAALAAGMIGGVAVAATAGVLAFGGDHEPEPGASATAAVTPDRPLLTPSPRESHGDDDAPRPEGSAGASAGESPAPRGEAREDTGTGTGAQPDPEGTGHEGRSGQRWARLASACRDYRDGHLDPGSRHTLEDAARGAEQVQKYCKVILKDSNVRDSDEEWGDPRSGHGDSGGDGRDGDDRGGDGRGDGESGDDGSGGDSGGDGDGPGDIGTGTFRGDTDAVTPTPRISALTVQESLPAVPSSATPRV